jgi:hypothetical protein
MSSSSQQCCFVPWTAGSSYPRSPSLATEPTLGGSKLVVPQNGSPKIELWELLP